MKNALLLIKHPSAYIQPSPWLGIGNKPPSLMSVDCPLSGVREAIGSDRLGREAAMAGIGRRKLPFRLRWHVCPHEP
jgi:hypothetical protein